MCELFALSAKYPCHVKLSLAQFVKQASDRNQDGWGLANMEGSDAYIYREPVSAQKSFLAQFLAQEGVNGDIILSHVRHCTVGDVRLANTHPFSREWQGQNHLFLFNGDTPAIFDLFEKTKHFQSIGDTDAEWAFCVLLERLIAAKNNNLNIMDVIHAFGCELAELGPCNFLYAVGSRLYAFASRRRYPDGEREPGLWRLTRQCKEAKTDIVAPGIQLQPGIAIDQQVILCASIPITEEAWQPFLVNELICISKGQLIDQRSLG
ncbi:MAG: class II glutamine amidotransferase [Methylococcales bacterium]|nr:class II glutamine amidotransferase [Methylococcales bacterium]